MTIKYKGRIYKAVDSNESKMIDAALNDLQQCNNKLAELKKELNYLKKQVSLGEIDVSTRQSLNRVIGKVLAFQRCCNAN